MYFTYLLHLKSQVVRPNFLKGWKQGLRTPNEGIDQRYLKNWADVADKIRFGRT